MPTENRLLDLYIPPEGFVLESLIATTYAIDFEFVEEELLPVALGVRTPVSKMRPFRTELERQLSKCEVTLLYDLGRCDHLARLSPRVDAIPISNRKLHAKIVFLLWSRRSTDNGELPEKRARFIVGSANLTRQGFRENYEVVTALDYGGRNRTPRALLEAGLQSLRTIAAETTSPQLAAQLMAAARFARTLPPGDLTPDFPRRFVTAAEVVHALADAWQELGASSPQRITIASPFWPEGDKPAEPILTLIQRLGVPKQEVELICAGRPTSDGRSWLPVLPSPIAAELQRQLRCRVFVRPALPNVGVQEVATDDPGDETEDEEFRSSRQVPAASVQRALHAKLIAVQGSTSCVLYIGSSNVTRRGLALGAAPNWEAGFVYLLRPKQRGLIGQLTTFAGKPVEVLPDQVPPTLPLQYEPEKPIPSFLREVVACGSRITVHFREGTSIPSDLVLLMEDKAAGADGRYWLLLGPRGGGIVPNPLTVDLEHCAQCDAHLQPIAALDNDAHRLIVPYVRIEVWWDGFQSVFPVRFDDKTTLPPVLFVRRPSERELIDYFLLGRDPSTANGALESLPREADDRIPSDEPIDTRRILSYFIRRFVQAIPGMEAAVRDAAYSRAALHSALFGPTSPLALARQAVDSLVQPATAGEPKKTPIAVGFQLVEITAALLRCRNQTTDEELQSIFDRAIAECRHMLDTVCARYPDQLATGPFEVYRRQFTEHVL